MPLLVSCGNFEQIEIGEPKDLKLRGFQDNYLLVDVAIPIENPTLHHITLREMDVKVFLNNQYIGKLLIDETVKIKPKSDEIYQLPVKIRLANILSTAFIMMNMKPGVSADLRFEGEVVAGTRIFKKSLPIKESRKVKF